MLKTKIFADVHWLGMPVWQRVTDLSIQALLEQHREFEADRNRSRTFLITQHRMGWLRRTPEA